jgi:hypothetical protein
LVSAPAAEASLGYRDGFSLHLAANAVVPLLTAKSYRPSTRSAGCPASIWDCTCFWARSAISDAGAQLSLNTERSISSISTGLLVGYRLAF